MVVVIVVLFVALVVRFVGQVKDFSYSCFWSCHSDVVIGKFEPYTTCSKSCKRNLTCEAVFTELGNIGEI